MWGFSELAKQAEAAAAAAAQTASSTSSASWVSAAIDTSQQQQHAFFLAHWASQCLFYSPPFVSPIYTSMFHFTQFNLDALQESDEKNKQQAAASPPAKKPEEPATGTPTETKAAATKPLAPIKVPVAPPPRPKGKLQVQMPTAKTAAPTKPVKAEEKEPPQPQEPPEETKVEAPPSEEPDKDEDNDAGDSDGWDDEEDLELEDEDEGQEKKAPVEPPPPAVAEKEALPEVKETPLSDAVKEIDKAKPSSLDGAMQVKSGTQKPAPVVEEKDVAEPPESIEAAEVPENNDKKAAPSGPETPEEESTSDEPPQRESDTKTTDKVEAETNGPVVEPTPEPSVSPKDSPDSATNGDNGTVEKEQLMTMFSQQIKRVEADHQSQLAELERRHAEAMRESTIAIKKAQEERKEVEKRLNGEIQKKHEQLSEVLRKNEGLKLKIDTLQREVSGMQELLEKGNSNLGKASAVHKRDIKVLQEQLMEREEKASKAKMEAEKAESTRKAISEELEKTQKEHSELKKRSAEMAIELEERRAECKNLRTAVDELSEKNESLEQSVESLTLQLSNHNISKSEKDGEMDRLKTELDEANRTIAQLKSESREKEEAAEATLNEYKKKAQNSLAMANSRTASAVEAKEEAELEARAARSTADSAMDRAVKAEIASKEAVAEARAYVSEMEKTTAKAKAELDAAKKDLEIFRTKADELQKELDALVGEKNKLVTDLAHTQGRFEDEQEKTRNLKDESERFKQQAKTARDEVGKLRQQIRRLEGLMADAQESKEASKQAQQKEALADRDDATIAMLQNQLRDANCVIEDLKSALNNAAEKHEAVNATESHSSDGNGSRESMPLFYAMEKQAELKTAQNEINRLANLLADIQSEKMEAIEAKEEMRQQMEDAQAKLERFQKLSNAAPAEQQGGLEPLPENSAATNIEYLKNIMMRYLNAKTVAEKKGLVPVIAAVLCLTHEEQQRAIKALDESASIGAVGNSLFESFSGRFK